MGFLDLKHEAFGLDINDSSLKIVKLKKKQKGFILSSFNDAKIAPGIIEDGVIKNEASLARIIKFAYDTAKGNKIKTKYVVAALPEEKSFMQVIQMPKMNDEELKVAVPLEAENYIPLPIDEVYLDFQPIAPIKDYFNYLEILIVATPKKIVDSYVSCLKMAELIPAVLEVESGAIARALSMKESNLSPLIIIDFGEDKTHLIIYSGSSIRFTSSISISSNLLVKSVSESLNISLHEAEKLKTEHGLVMEKNYTKAGKATVVMSAILEELSGQIKKYINFYRNHSSYEYLLPEGKKERVFLCGGGAELKGLADFISKKLALPVEPADPTINFLSGKLKTVLAKKDKMSFVTATGLALRQTISDLDNSL